MESESTSGLTGKFFQIFFAIVLVIIFCDFVVDFDDANDDVDDFDELIPVCFEADVYDFDELVPVFFEADVDAFDELVPVFFEADELVHVFFEADELEPFLGVVGDVDDVGVVGDVDVILDVFKLSDSFEVVLFSVVFWSLLCVRSVLVPCIFAIDCDDWLLSSVVTVTIVFGFLGMSSRNNSRPERMIINGVGEGGILVCNSNGNIENGDYITSSDYLGYGEKQDEFFLCNYTVAKATMDCNFELNSNLYNCLELENGIRAAFIAVTYHCG